MESLIVFLIEQLAEPGVSNMCGGTAGSLERLVSR